MESPSSKLLARSTLWLLICLGCAGEPTDKRVGEETVPTERATVPSEQENAEDRTGDCPSIRALVGTLETLPEVRSVRASGAQLRITGTCNRALLRRAVEAAGGNACLVLNDVEEVVCRRVRTTGDPTTKSFRRDVHVYSYDTEHETISESRRAESR